MSRRPSRPVQASRLHGARWTYTTDGECAELSLASEEMPYGTVELLPLRGERRWHVGLTSALVDLTDCVDGHVRGGQRFRTKRRAMRWLETIAIAAWRRVEIAAAKKVAKMRAQDREALALAATFASSRREPEDVVEPLAWALDACTRGATETAP